ncbi:protein maternal effect lethal 26-like [Nylanderia fulva]|uniref:protein maternal effect lethal 26-like n=1 Tax=Nylanderia fulva TaxID=613905 RepID=UPI0010FB3BDA|nr:protein maternal effect lethal 26-like [Nylanderia fulva]
MDRVITHLQIAKQLFSEEFPETALYRIKLSIDIDTHDKLNNKVKFYLLTKEKFMGICQISLISNYAVNSNKVYHCYSYKGSMTDMTLLCELPIKLLDTEILSEEKIVINFKFEILHQFQNQSIHMNLTTIDTIVRKNFNFNDKESITFIVNKSRYTLSKNRLRCISSTYFNELCDKLEKNKTNEFEIKINDKKFSLAYEGMLLFILTDSLPTSLDYDKLKYILITADKYKVNQLKLTCERYLLRIINIQNSVKLIMLAFSCNAKLLEEKVATFIKLYLKEVALYNNFSHLSQKDRNKIFESINKINIPCRSQLVKFDHLEL